MLRASKLIHEKPTWSRKPFKFPGEVSDFPALRCDSVPSSFLMFFECKNIIRVFLDQDAFCQWDEIRSALKGQGPFFPASSKGEPSGERMRFFARSDPRVKKKKLGDFALHAHLCPVSRFTYIMHAAKLNNITLGASRVLTSQHRITLVIILMPPGWFTDYHPRSRPDFTPEHPFIYF